MDKKLMIPLAAIIAVAGSGYGGKTSQIKLNDLLGRGSDNKKNLNKQKINHDDLTQKVDIDKLLKSKMLIATPVG